MSTQEPRIRVQTQCCDQHDCTETYRMGTGERGYCSLECWSYATASQLLESVQRDHRWCANCFRRLRTVTPPPPEWHFGGDQAVTREAVIGWAVPEPHTVEADGERLQASSIPGEGLRATDQTTRRNICSCGVTHHGTIERSTLSKSACRQHATRLAEAITARQELGLHQHEIDPPALRYAVSELKSTRDLAGDDGEIFHRSLAAVLRYKRRS